MRSRATMYAHSVVCITSRTHRLCSGTRVLQKQNHWNCSIGFFRCPCGHPLSHGASCWMLTPPKKQQPFQAFGALPMLARISAHCFCVWFVPQVLRYTHIYCNILDNLHNADIKNYINTLAMTHEYTLKGTCIANSLAFAITAGAFSSSVVNNCCMRP